MPLHNLDTFVDQELGSIGLGGCAAIPSARAGTTSLFCGLQGTFGIGVGDSSAGVNGLLYRPS